MTVFRPAVVPTLLGLVALSLTKTADRVTIRLGLQVHEVAGQQDLLTRLPMRRFGRAGGIAFVVLLWYLLVAACYVPTWFSPPWYQWAAANDGWVVFWAQWELTRFNVTRRDSCFLGLSCASISAATHDHPA